MKIMILTIYSVVCLSTMQNASGGYYAILLSGKGMDEEVMADDVEDVESALLSGNWKGYNNTGHIRTITYETPYPDAPSKTAFRNAFASISTLITSQGDTDAKVLVYVSCHGGTSSVYAGEDVPPSLNVWDEFIVYDTNSGDGEYDDTFANAMDHARYFFIADTCRSGGFARGNDGDMGSNLTACPLHALLAACGEEENTPLDSILKERFVTLILESEHNLTPSQIATEIEYEDYYFQGKRRDYVGGEDDVSHFGDILTGETCSSFFFDGGSGDDVFFEYVPEPTTLSLLGIGAVTLLVYTCKRRKLSM